MTPEGAAVGWQTGPSRRGTLTIIENCLFTIIACTWSIQHPNVPRLDEAWWRTFRRQCKWTLLTLFFPEFLMAHAILEIVMIVGNIKSLNEEDHLDKNLPWFFRWIGQPLARSKDTEAGVTVPGVAGQQEVKWTLTHCYFANMGGFYIHEDAGPSSAVKIHLLTTSHFIKCWQSIKIPSLSEDDLKDKSKTDYFTKALAVIQIAQLLLSLVARAVQHLAVSQLETLTLAFAICGVLTYGCSWYKPQNVKRPIQVFLRRPTEGLPPEIRKRTFDSLWQVLSNLKATDWAQPLERVPNDNIPKIKPSETHYALYVLTALTAAFGSIHAIAWNFEFPTSTERLLWRIATLISTAVPPLALLAIPLAQILRPWGDIGDFRQACLDVMREYSWHASQNQSVQKGMKTLTKLCDNPTSFQHEHFRDILGDGDDSNFLGSKILEYIHKDEEVKLCLPKGFLPKFTQLVEILRGSPCSKRLWDAARTDTYPKRSLLSPLVNDGIIYITSIVYCVARLTVIGIAFSSLRRMPDSVYVTSWTTNIPSVQ
ncbi:hypothetical protein FHL15_007863 [Xylaria flabelliformis]|uniref:Uncharacterized protein n=1 Tax=Xylaria flabelliformis TaxID=2512241 RepID=A0A553HTH9_9PEZI|nr:hypothetical protein FHL15_007863 [Xylaria flabelliformis]